MIVSAMTKRVTKSYPETINLPFNREILSGGFTPAPGEDDAGEEGYWIVLQGGAVVVRDPQCGGILPEGDLPLSLSTDNKPLYLGRWQGKPLRVVQLERERRLPAPWFAEAMNAVEERLDDRILTLGGIAQQVLHWLRQSAHCCRCGHQTEPIPRSWARACPACHSEHFPSISPCIIVLVRRGEEYLLTRKAEWVPGRYSLVAGFLDMGESLEECVSREVLEETGIAVTNIRYLGSQSWPFPSQLMAGFVADYAGGEVVVDREELEDARWFRRGELPLLPARRSIARWIIDRFVSGP